MTTTVPAPSPTGRRELLARAAEAVDALGMFAEVSRRLRRLLPYDAAVWRVTDPVTGMMTAPVRVENLDEGGCAAYWESELFTENVNLFRDLALAPVPVAGLRRTTGDLPARSTLYQDFMRPRGLRDELRAVLRVGGRPHGHISLFRAEGRAAFDSRDTALLAALSTPLARRLRTFSEPTAPLAPAAFHGPGLLLFDASGVLLSANDEARVHLANVPEGPAVPSALGLRIPTWIQTTAMKARAVAQQRDRGRARIRVRTRTGRWLICHASCLREADGGPGPSAVVIEPARASDVVPLIVDAYEFTDREAEVTQYIARGLPTGEIARRLHLSPHTVRDHIKAVFEKAAVSSRGELVSRLFTEHYAPLAESGTLRTTVPDGDS
ncbi:LuxR C-terminal-related transcriptional regulator [Streptomyces sp. NPDC059816]|uniref:LuxR C-terminal-related transcriptional regulator n=1 Tax=Streptomyces sp. NPDC059816 TaxID=3346960 RepID=UPI00365C1C0C